MNYKLRTNIKALASVVRKPIKISPVSGYSAIKSCSLGTSPVLSSVVFLGEIKFLQYGKLRLAAD